LLLKKNVAKKYTFNEKTTAVMDHCREMIVFCKHLPASRLAQVTSSNSSSSSRRGKEDVMNGSELRVIE